MADVIAFSVGDIARGRNCQQWCVMGDRVVLDELL
jgi:hypothetical protein